LSNREIAARYSISASRVKTRIESIFRRFGVSSRTQAVAERKKLDLI
jgi:ATP/maltotriose-dependent transcriptional regulator MalT